MLLFEIKNEIRLKTSKHLFMRGTLFEIVSNDWQQVQRNDMLMIKKLILINFKINPNHKSCDVEKKL